MILFFLGPHCPVVLQFWENMFLSEHATTKCYQHSYQRTCLPQAQICGCLTLQQSARLKSWINSTSWQPPKKLPKFPCPSPQKKTWGPHPDEGPELLSEFWSAGTLPTFSHFSFWTLRSKPWRGTWSASQKDKASILHLWNLGTCTAPDQHDVNSTERLAPDGQLSVESHGTPPAESTAQLQSWHRCHSHDITRLGQLMSVGQREHSLLSKEEQSTTSSLWNVPELKLLLWISLWFLNTRHAMGQGLISSYFHVLHGSICISYFCHHACPLAKPVWLTWMHFGWSNTIVGLRHLSFPRAQWVSKVRWWSNPSNQAKLMSATHLSGCVKLLQFRPPLSKSFETSVSRRTTFGSSNSTMAVFKWFVP